MRVVVVGVLNFLSNPDILVSDLTRFVDRQADVVSLRANLFEYLSLFVN